MSCKDYNFVKLLDTYDSILPANKRAIVRNYYDFDMSLGELAQMFGMTPQGIRSHIAQVKSMLVKYESLLGLLSMKEKLQKLRMHITDVDTIKLLDEIINSEEQ